MEIKDIIDIDVVNYKKLSMTVIMPYCDFKCNKDAGKVVCHNYKLAHTPNVNMSIMDIANAFDKDTVVDALILQGLEPFHPKSIEDVYTLLRHIRLQNDTRDIVIYTGYTEAECKEMGIIDRLNKIDPEIIVKFGRYIPDDKSHYDEVLGINLASENQYAKRIKDCV